MTHEITPEMQSCIDECVECNKMGKDDDLMRRCAEVCRCRCAESCREMAGTKSRV